MHGEESPFCWANEGAANSAPAAISRVSFRVLIVFSCPFAELADHVVVVGEVDAFGVGYGGHVGDDDFVALFEAVVNLDASQRRAAELDAGSHCFRTIIDDPKKVNAAVRLAVYRASDEENAIQPFDVDRSTDIETGGDSLRDSIKGDVHSARAVGYCANAADVPACARTFLGGDCGVLTGLQVGGQGGRNRHASD